MISSIRVITGLVLGSVAIGLWLPPPHSTASSPLPSSPVASPDGVPTLPGAWTPMSQAPIEGRIEYSVVWTGTEAIYWGGAAIRGRRDGAAYDPAAATWRRIARAPIPGRYGHTAVWTGERMLVWGGWRGEVQSDGAAYDPVANTWSRLATPDGPVGQVFHEAVWTGSRMLVYGGIDFPHEPVVGGLSYDPETDSWEPIPPDPFGPLAFRSIAWTGSEMFLYGYSDDDPDGTASMALYDPSGATWRPVTDFALSSWSGQPLAADRSLMLIDSQPRGRDDDIPTSAILDLGSATWQIPSSEPPDNSATLPEVWTGSVVLFPGWQGVAYEPSRDTWWRLPEAPPGSVHREQIPTVWAGDRVLIWSGTRGESIDPLEDGMAFIPD